MTSVRLRLALVPPTLVGPIIVSPGGLPRFWPTIWADVHNAALKPTTRKQKLGHVDRLYEAVRLQRGFDCLDALIADERYDDIEDAVIGFLAHLRNDAAINGTDRAEAWQTALAFVTTMLRGVSVSAPHRIDEIEGRLRRLEQTYRQLAPNPKRPPPPIRALSPTVIRDLYEIFDPTSPRNPFKSLGQRWRNLLVFLLLLRLGLRRGELALLTQQSFKEDLDYRSGRTVRWLDVAETDDIDPRYEKPGLKTEHSRRQLPLPDELAILAGNYCTNFRHGSAHSHLLISQQRQPLSLRSISEVFEIATRALSAPARKALNDQGLSTISCHEFRHTCAVVRMQGYQDQGHALDAAAEKLRTYFGWSPESKMPALYARAYFDPAVAEVWNESFDGYVDALRRATLEGPM